MEEKVHLKDYSVYSGEVTWLYDTGIYTCTVRYLQYKYKLLLPVSGTITEVYITYLHNQPPVPIAYFVQWSLTPPTPLFSLSLSLSLSISLFSITTYGEH